ncbi:BZ3500_MvSof-1268-A1-R1_Chr4-2g06926 [Microbotryum saponariae]|uniref:BZ3500_MvSof-1268-A1-R1_Chr4-2g06926 protein n=1 Tax=Microbotryum saponariae TaxID=289078 RepID=A0A2X0KYH5_9BASI|nr:BZ3500_MvSof-1268-A1-R1_Chr4-2g06926 [Microbotryum saponariae]SDA06591.1 BZ3501_MvSof-1269-A2-R1_Chr4-2g06637 [Microbotryum saponariae]
MMASITDPTPTGAPSPVARGDPDCSPGAGHLEKPRADIQVEHEQSYPRRSSRWDQLVLLDAHIARLEETESSPTASAAAPSFVLIILDPLHVLAFHQPADQFYLFCPFPEKVAQHRVGAEVGAFLAEALDRLAFDSLVAMATSANGANDDHVEDLRPNDRTKLEDSIQGFQEQSLLGVGIALRSAAAVERKVKALMKFHGLSPLCSSIILGEHFRPIGSSFSTNSNIFNKLYYVTESDLAKLSTAISSTPGPFTSHPDTAVADPSAAGSPRRRPQLDQSRFSSGSSSRNVGINLAKSFSDPLPLTPGDGRHLEPLVAIWRQTPPPCHNFYLSSSGCPHGTSCKFGHDYILSGRDFADLRSSVQRMPCDSVKEGSTKPCSFGNECLYGHVCPYDDKCAWNRCKFGSIAHPRKNASRSNSGHDPIPSSPSPSSTSGAAPSTSAPSPTSGGRQPGQPSCHAGMEGWSRKRQESVSK